ncbi:hypothetical protein L209DRAFT_594156 [Thermothelomyces heterothallicus CBS 203.75]
MAPLQAVVLSAAGPMPLGYEIACRGPIDGARTIEPASWQPLTPPTATHCCCVAAILIRHLRVTPVRALDDGLEQATPQGCPLSWCCKASPVMLVYPMNFKAVVTDIFHRGSGGSHTGGSGSLARFMGQLSRWCFLPLSFPSFPSLSPSSGQTDQAAFFAPLPGATSRLQAATRLRPYIPAVHKKPSHAITGRQAIVSPRLLNLPGADIRHVVGRTGQPWCSRLAMCGHHR